MGIIIRKCLNCDREQKTYQDESKEYEKVIVCPKCNGAFVDRFYYDRYVKKQNDKPLLVIELQDEISVPKVFYKGKEVTHKQNVFLEWNTDTEIMGGLTYSIEHADLGKGYPVTNRIERKVKGHACD